MSVGEYVKDNIWVPIVIGVVGVVALTLLLAVLYCVFLSCYRNNRRRHYAPLREGRDSASEDTISYGSLVLREEEEAKTGVSTPAVDVKPSTPGQSIQTFSAGQRTTSTAGLGGGTGGGGKEIGLHEAWTQRRQSQISKDRETAVLACQFHVRNTMRYTLQHNLADIGSRMHKYWFLALPNTSSSRDLLTDTQLLLTVAPASKHCPLHLQGASLQTLNELLAALKHPYLQPISEVDYIADKNMVVVVQPFSLRGSIKDLIYKTQPLNEWSLKYSVRRKGLSPHTIALYGRQILEALVFLYKKGFPPLGHVQSGNVLIEEGSESVCRLSGYENTLLGYRTRQYKLFAEHADSIDVLMFGHLLFEMGYGYELTSLLPQQPDYQAVPNEALLQVLQFIFSSDGGDFPSISQVLQLPFFQQAGLPQRDKTSVHLSSEMRVLLKAVRRGRPVEVRVRAKRSSSRQSSEDLSETRYPVTQLKASTVAAVTPPPAQSVRTKPALPAKPALLAKPLLPPRKPHPTSSRPPPASRPPPKPSGQSRGALLKDIHKGTKLKKAATSDRSAPRLQ